MQLDSEGEVHMDHLSSDVYVDEVEDFGIGLEDSDGQYRSEHGDNEAEGHGKGSSDDEWESDVLLTLENSGSEEDDSDDRPSRGLFRTYGKQKLMADS